MKHDDPDRLLPREIEDRLDVAHELTAVEAIEEGLADWHAGRVAPHDEVMEEIRKVIEGAQRGTAPGTTRAPE